MRQITALLFLLLASGAALSRERCPVTEREIIGAWSRSGDSGFFEEFLLEEDAGVRTFSSWLHQRPELSGASWTLEDCRLVVAPQHGEFGPFRFKVLALKRGKLRLYDESEQLGSIYVRLPDEP
jgi:hypothetical protein